MVNPTIEIPGKGHEAAQVFSPETQSAPNFLPDVERMNPLEARPAVLNATAEQLLALGGTLAVAGLVVAGVYTIINGRTPWQKKSSPTMIA